MKDVSTNHLLKYCRTGSRNGHKRGSEFVGTFDQDVIFIAPNINIRVRHMLYVNSKFLTTSVRSVTSNDYNGKWLHST
jgi:hypothetical protein